MKLCQFENKGGERAIGIAVGDGTRIADLRRVYESITSADQAAYRVPSELLQLILDGAPGMDAARAVEERISASPNLLDDPAMVHGVDSVRIGAPVTRPPKFFAVAINTRHNWERAIKPPKPNPTYFIKLNTCIIGPTDTIHIPDVGYVGPEVELAVIIGKGGKNIPVENALDHVFGYTVHNDITAHEMRKTTEWIQVPRPDGTEERLTYSGRYKNYDTFSPMGPWLHTANEVPNPNGLTLRAWLNDDLVQEGTTADHVYSAQFLISYLSKAHTLEAGDIISTGTVPPKPPWTHPKINLGQIGGVLTTRIDGLGDLCNPIHFDAE
jgi:2-keto-4-pentenoate hydratase/2-oxohepta-3-ene-1,7-dioic acid hydratase in catechol pathway